MKQEQYDCKRTTYQNNCFADFVKHCAPKAWKEFFGLPAVQPAIASLTFQIAEQAKTSQIEPPIPLMFEVLEMVAPWNVKVVIFGQDPTPQEHKATGLAFSVKKIYGPLGQQ